LHIATKKRIAQSWVICKRDALWILLRRFEMADIRPYTALAADNELIFLSRLHSMLESDPITTRDSFADMMAVAFTANRLDTRVLSDEMGYSFSTVYRWVEGRTAPHRSQWTHIQEWVSKALKAHIDALRVRSRELAMA
jgi:hypothetical protein